MLDFFLYYVEGNTRVLYCIYFSLSADNLSTKFAWNLFLPESMVAAFVVSRWEQRRPGWNGGGLSPASLLHRAGQQQDSHLGQNGRPHVHCQRFGNLQSKVDVDFEGSVV